MMFGRYALRAASVPPLLLLDGARGVEAAFSSFAFKRIEGRLQPARHITCIVMLSMRVFVSDGVDLQLGGDQAGERCRCHLRLLGGAGAPVGRE